ncbi:NADH kinase [Malassezia sp. CBS 17886]|nr:NADH kinase [Malassezia sp. CBS 17886]
MSTAGAPALAALPRKVPIAMSPRASALGHSTQRGDPADAAAGARAAHQRDVAIPVGSTYGGEHAFRWEQPPQNVLLVKKRDDEKATHAMCDVLRYLGTHHPGLHPVVEDDVWVDLHAQFPNLVPFSMSSRIVLADKIDFVITLGGDGSILHVSSLFDQSAVPPILSFSLGTLGFLLPYDIRTFPEAIDDVVHSRIALLLRMRMCVTLWGAAPGECLGLPGEAQCRALHFMNEIVLHRGREPHMATMDAYVNEEHLTRSVADGLILSTPTGSTAYSLSAGGPIVHPSVATMMLTPICPRSLSFRTILLPCDSNIHIVISATSRSPAEVSVDGRAIHTLHRLQAARVQMSPFPIPCVNFSPDKTAARRCGSFGAEVDPAPSPLHEDWVYDVNTLLRFNAPFLPRDRERSAALAAAAQRKSTFPAALRNEKHRATPNS